MKNSDTDCIENGQNRWELDHHSTDSQPVLKLAFFSQRNSRPPAL
ncbi:MAG TPA: hypothetical protein VMI12_12120 [Puia sp.]|nr:hypothetical protein [Puia sp.]